MLDRRAKIIDAAMLVLRERGFAGLTQPRVAKEVGMRQSLLTYYYPTRFDLLAAVGRNAVDRQLAAVRAMLGALVSLDQAAAAIATLVTQHGNTRVLMALAQAADQEPRLREVFGELVDGIVAEVDLFLARTGGRPAGPNAARLLHAASVGMAVVTLAMDPEDARERMEVMIRDLLDLLVPPAAARTASGRASQGDTA